MLSIIISSKDNNQLSKLTNNFKLKAVDDIEFIPILNENGNLSISEAYNHGAKKSNGSILVFTHEDIIMHTEGWDRIIKEKLSDETIGILGQAGANYKSRQISAWIDVPNQYYISSAIAGWRAEKFMYDNRDSKESFVVVVDGMFMAMRRNVWQKFPFDDKTFQGFHGYDMDISLAIGQQYKLLICNDLLIEHLSPGNFDSRWYDEAKKFHYKWKTSLPKTYIKINKKERKIIEYHVATNMLRRSLAIKKFNNIDKLQILSKMFYFKPLIRENIIWSYRVLKSILNA